MKDQDGGTGSIGSVVTVVENGDILVRSCSEIVQTITISTDNAWTNFQLTLYSDVEISNRDITVAYCSCRCQSFN